MYTRNIISKSYLVSIYYRTDHKERSAEFSSHRSISCYTEFTLFLYVQDPKTKY
ncbi:conserved hypothetical protein [Leptospira interrogans serovar Manilae]|uniref:Uncharacterized protein n=1 Tax=Leptospira interrogans serovar Manilae TaxID=214675 RepID=A0AAQ1P2U7_LEPIR|nr:conserved hypothetical protein [Leptospira interrogans serovar Manilae]